MTGAAQPPPFAPYERTSYVLVALALLAALLLHLVPALLAGFLAWVLLNSMARRSPLPSFQSQEFFLFSSPSTPPGASARPASCSRSSSRPARSRA